MACEFLANTTLIDLMLCFFGTLFGGIDWNIIAIFIVALVGILVYKLRLPTTLVLTFSFALLYAFWVMSAESAYFVLVIMALVGFGIAIKVALSILSFVGQTA
jgi:hypothetical protein